MASVQERSGKYRIQFYFGGRRCSLNLGKAPPRVAEAKSAKVDEVLAFLDSGYLSLPRGLTSSSSSSATAGRPREDHPW